MDSSTARVLAELNRHFYESNWESFSSTRGSAWPGWAELVRLLPAVGGRSLRVLDIACGNLRLERFLAEEFPETTIQALAIDSCDELALAWAGAMPANADVRYERVDLIDLLTGEGDVLPLGAADARHDLVACFGFMHHVPGFELRARLLRLMADALGPGGLLAVSLWRFMDDANLAEKARLSTQRAVETGAIGDLQLDSGDYLLGWNGESDALRYCHHFDGAEIDALVGSLSDGPGNGVELVARYRADGRTGALNEYLVFRRAGAF
ncbi:MAG: class I SAM-dependent methyltransferase [Coriobacteriales bacterium]